jgi:hypothetical protein
MGLAQRLGKLTGAIGTVIVHNQQGQVIDGQSEQGVHHLWQIF